MKPLDAEAISDGVKALSDTLANKVPGVVIKTIQPTLDALAEALRGGDFQKARDLITEISFDEGIAATEKGVRAFSRSAAILGGGAVDKPQTTLIASGAPIPWEVDRGAVGLVQSMVQRQLNRDTKKKLRQRVDAASRFQKAAPIDPDKLANDINRFLRGEIRRVVDVSANVVGTRVSAYGMFYEARARGITRYRIDAIRDDRTSDICKALDGKIFDVERAFERTGQVLSATDASQQKKLAPFPPQVKHEIDALLENSDEDLQSMGFDVPPFHFLCRSVVTLIDEKVDYDPVDWSNFPETATEAVAHERAITPQLDRVARRVFGFDDLDELFDEALKSSPGDELYPPSAYSGSAYRQINDYLRTNHPFEAGSDLPDMIKTLDDLIDKSPAPDVTYAYRGVTGAVADRFAVGKVFQDDAFMSVSLDTGVAESFSGAFQNILQIQIGTGHKVLPLYAASTVTAEAELLLARGTQLRIIGSARQTLPDGQEVIVWRAVAQGQGDVLAVDDIGKSTLPEAISVVKAENRTDEKFLYEAGDLREAS